MRFLGEQNSLMHYSNIVSKISNKSISSEMTTSWCKCTIHSQHAPSIPAYAFVVWTLDALWMDMEDAYLPVSPEQ